MSLRRNLILLLFSVIPIVGICQSSIYLDADTPSEAVGMMKNSIVTAEVMRRECIARFPAIQNEIDRDLQKWQNAEVEAIKKAEFYWAAMVKKQPSISSALELTEQAVKNNFDLLSKVPEQEYCKQYFAVLASGIWRKRTPKIYEYLDNAQ